MKDGLTCITVAVQDGAIPASGEAAFVGNRRGASDERAHESVIPFQQIVERRDVTLRNHEDVRGCLGVDVLECHHLVVFIDALGRDLTSDYLAKQARHAGSIALGGQWPVISDRQRGA